MKNWRRRNHDLVHIDICRRDAPCICIDNEIIIGTDKDSHATLISKIIYGINIEDVDDADIVENAESSGGKYFRSDIDEENVAYGHVLNKNIYWDITEDKTRAEVKYIVCNARKIKGYTHYSLNPFDGLSTKF